MGGAPARGAGRDRKHVAGRQGQAAATSGPAGPGAAGAEPGAEGVLALRTGRGECGSQLVHHSVSHTVPVPSTEYRYRLSSGMGSE